MRSASSRLTGSRFKGYEDFIVQDLVLRPHVVRIRRERWLTPDGHSRRCRLGVPAPLGLNCAASCCCNPIRARSPCRARSAQRGGPFVEDAVLRAGLETTPWISLDDTGARHRHRYCTQIGNDHFAAFTASKSRLNFLEVLRAGYADYVINAEAYMRQRALAGPVIKALAGHPDRHFADEAAWRDHLRRLGITDLEVNPDPVRIPTEGALGGGIQGLLPDTVSDDAGQFALEALCWVHAERLIHKLDTFTDQQYAAQQRLRAGLVVRLKGYRRDPRRRAPLRAPFDRIFRRRTGFATLDRLLDRLSQGRVAARAGPSRGAAAHQRLRARSPAAGDQAQDLGRNPLRSGP